MFKAFTSRLLPVAVAALMLGCHSPSSQPAAPTPNAEAEGVVLTTPVNKYALTIPVVIAGKSYTFLVDTGAAFTVLDNQIAATLTEKAADNDVPSFLLESDTIDTASGVMSKNDVTFWRSLPMRIGHRDVHDAMPWHGLDLTHVTQALGQRIDGILGAEVIRQLNWQVDNKAGTLTIRDGSPSLASYDTCMPYNSSFGNGPEIAVDLPEGQWALMQIDTGSMDLYASPELLAALRDGHSPAEALPPGPSSEIDGVSESALYRISGLTLNGTRLGAMTAATSLTGTNNMGMNFLSRLDRYALSPNLMVFCYTAANLSRDEPKAVRSVGIAFIHGRLEVAYNNPARIRGYGLENGDVLLEVNKQRARPEEIQALRQQVSNTPAGRLKLVIERQGTRKTLTL
ncbi:Aspartyl protease [Dyella jiangningensis]|uniref:aspartyl protease family protein n=1 Tax=Dyella sp. AtDHG13 TaxID=1938897 RepID=UPI000881A20E|nr:aspartyl protease family protein [Dyella sp. AtDHG13]PXV58366.1 aspartyl protease [Dyella sp. AtDHG13]SDK05372.1 Aspartyl protease [Dyella jiangningensis]